ncbi:ABC transporter permease subunit [Paenibacillus filicis]|uniref:ABC transporter permease subunit n=1 Tax=Paenibacillus gyeongsangnamensis TaxID=3388067 RepID=A0ABT4QJQ2_9BACL|nr:ABC transporter permease subunit [Paenibacillus filicis]MCZ8517079.1 ABC transporter permease subunit [Paenibacillus filicis]
MKILEQGVIPGALSNKEKTSLWSTMLKYRHMYLLVLPGLVFFIIFKIIPMWGLLVAFQDYTPILGMLHSKWVGFKHFIEFFQYDSFYNLLRNTLVINLFSLVFLFPLPILLSIMLNEVRHEVFKRINQSIVYIPHFLSWVIITSLTFFMLSTDVGLINKAIRGMGHEPFPFLNEPHYFWGLLTIQNIWKDMGWGTIIFLAAIAGVDPSRYEAAVIDGASRMRQIWHITLPAIRPTILILLILRLGHIADVSFEQVLLMLNPLVLSVGDVFDTYAYKQGILSGQTSVGVAVGMFKDVVGLVLVLISNYVVKKLGHEGIY